MTNNRTTFTNEEWDNGEAQRLAFAYLDGIVDADKRTAMRDKIAKDAKRNGVETFKSQYNEHHKRLQAESKSVAVGETQFSGQPKLKCGSYLCDDDGIRNGTRIISLQPIYPANTVVNVEDGHESMVIKYKTRSGWREATVKKSSIAAVSELVKLADYGVQVTSSTARPLGDYLSEIEHRNRGEGIAEVDGVSHLGWVDEKRFVPYIDGAVYDGAEDTKRTFEALKTPSGTIDEWLRIASKLRAESYEARFVLAASFASPLLEKLGALNFIVHIWGQTGYGKSVLQMFGASVWGDPDITSGYIQTFDSTKTGREVLAGFLYNIPIMLDELQLSAAAGEDDFGEEIYMLCSQKGRARSNVSLTFKQAGSWRCCTISTGEQPIAEQKNMGGALTRCVQIELKQSLCEETELPGIAESLKENYGHAGKQFVEAWIKADRDAWKRDYSDMRKRLTLKGVNPKRAASIASLYIADKFAGECMFQASKPLTVDDLLNLADAQAEVNPGKAALASIVSQIEQYKARFDGTSSTETWGCYELGETPRSIIKILPTAFDQIAKNGGFKPSVFYTWAKSNGVMIADKNRTDKQYREGDRYERYKVIDLDKAYQILSE